MGDTTTMRACLLVLVPSLLLAAGCASPRHFAPRDRQTAMGPGGDLAAVYDVTPSDSPARGEVRVWSRGAVRQNEGDRAVVDLHVGFELENHGQEPLSLDVAALSCTNLIVDGTEQPPLTPHSVLGDPVAAPGAMTHVDVVFRPQAAAPRDVDAFAVHFTVRSGDAAALTQLTPFAAIDDSAYYSWPYGPGWYGGWWGYRTYWGPWRPWGPGYGWYWGPVYCW